MVSKLEQKRHTNIMEFSSKFWKWACGIVAVTGIVVILGLGLREHHTISELKGERLELQDSIIYLHQEILERDQAALTAEQHWQEVHDNHIAEASLLKAELAKVRKNYKETLAEMTALDTSELKTYFIERYGQCADVDSVQDKFLMTVDAGNHIRYDLTDLDFCSEESNLKDSLIEDQARYIWQLDTMVNVLSTERNFYQNKAESFEQQAYLCEQAKANVQAGLNKQQTLTYILGGTAAVLAVGLVISLIAGGK